MKPYYWLDGAYAGVKVRRLAQFGRIYFDEVINDGPHYWLVAIRPLKEDIDRSYLDECNHGKAWGNGTRRFTVKAEAEGYFQKLMSYPVYQREEVNRQEVRKAKAERLRLARSRFAEAEKPLI
jgi:hypothetical protein